MPTSPERRPGNGAPPLRADARRNREAILDAATKVFAAEGARGSTELIAAGAGVAVGTVFRHFPTKADLLGAIMKSALDTLRARAQDLALDEANGLFDFFAAVTEEAAAKRVVVELLAETGRDAVGALGGFEADVDRLLRQAQRAGSARPDLAADQVIALLVALTQGIVAGRWDAELRMRTLSVVLDALRPGAR